METHQTIQDHALEHMPDDEATELEDTIWWHVGRQALLRPLLDRAARASGGQLGPILEAGCGGGGNLALLARYGDVVGCDPSPTLARRSRERGVAREVHACGLEDLPAEPGSFGLAASFDVMEHVADDAGFARRLATFVRPGGFYLASVPACPWLYSEHDRLLHHYRRYTRRSLARVLEEAGFRVEHSTYFVSTLFPVVAAARWKDRLLARFGKTRATVNVGNVPGPANAALTALLRVEALAASRIPLPMGVWAVALGRKR
ncbi:MAG: class I SAM-dependent methyltransferase [Isosphaeraceae bacterium]